LLPATEDLLRRFGERLRLARLRRRLPAKQVAERAGMSPMTLRSIERGGSGVTVGACLAVMQVLGIERDFDLLGRADSQGRELQDARLPGRARTSPRTQLPTTTTNQKQSTRRRPLPGRDGRSPGRGRQAVASLPSQPRRPTTAATAGASDWLAQGGFTSSATLAKLLEPMRPPRTKAR
jgi:transcriptional regulator with XRE-family HTH domain